jgi:hypothetical protein
MIVHEPHIESQRNIVNYRENARSTRRCLQRMELELEASRWPQGPGQTS